MLTLKKVMSIITFSQFLFLSNCSTPSEPDDTDFVYLSGTPVITGFHVTTNEHPYGTGEIIGTPAYVVNGINIFPNPSIENPDEVNSFNRFVTFTNLPQGKVTIIIVKGISEQESKSIKPSYFGTSNLAQPVSITKTIVKEDNNPFTRWELNNQTSSGYYRAYILGETIPENYFVDFSLTIEQIGPAHF
jgi:hypothetical protein